MCEWAFKQAYDLKHHIESIHNNIKAHQCELCGKEFTRKYTLRWADVKHVERSVLRFLRFFTVFTVFYGFYGISSLREKFVPEPPLTSGHPVLRLHLKSHTDARDYKCSTCQRGFFTKGKLLEHERTHTGQ
jgi:uncharacterized Zn-finger protein